MKKILVTGAAGFIGFHLIKSILKISSNCEIIGIDNLNDYYDLKLKESRLEVLSKFKNFRFIKMDLISKEEIDKLFIENDFEIVVNLAAQAVD